jgi:hypothetical protein
MRIVACLRGIGLGALVSSCSPELFFDAPEISAITVSAGPFLPGSVAELSVGEAVTLSAVVRQGDGNPIDGVSVDWRSTNPAVATVSTQGRVVAVAAGTASIRASFAGVTGVYGITVRPPVATVTLSPTAATLGIGSTQQLTATLRDASSTVLTGRTITWSSSNTAVAAVSATGLVTAGTAGTATVTATSEGRSGTATITVNTTSGLPAIAGVEFQFVVPDGGGGSFAAGRLTSTATIAGQTVVPTGAEDGVIVRYSSALVAQWVTRMTKNVVALSGGPSQSVSAAFGFTGSLGVVDPSGASSSWASVGGGDGVIVTLNSAGAIARSVRVFGGSATDVFTGVVMGPAGELYVSGVFNGCCTSTGSATLSTSAGNVTLNSIGFATGFLARINTSGVIQWVARFGGRDAGLTVQAMDAVNGRLFVWGGGPNQSTGSIVDGSGATTSVSCPTTDCPFLSSFSAATGALQWRGLTAFSGGGGMASLDMAVPTAGGEVFVWASCFGGGVTLSSTATSTTLAAGACGGTASAYQRLLLRYSSTGTPLSALPVTATGGFRQDPWLGGIAVTPTGVAVTTQFAGTLAAGSTSLTATATEEGAVLRMSSSFSVNSATRLRGAAGSINRLNDVVVTSSGALLLVGRGSDQAEIPSAFRLLGTGGLIVVIP